MPHQPIAEEPSTFWALITRFSLVGILLLFFGGMALLFLPRIKAHRHADEEIANLTTQVVDLQRKRDDLENQKILLTHDKPFVETKARDLLDLKKDGETVFRFKD
ncbi:MAG: septum formation initiator family protein [Verrucomicrobiales bacterium]|nr:septum formation initiator family protein [Verrucomicrobiales bacterium]